MFDEIQGQIKKLDVSVRSLRKTGTAFAEAERTYKTALMQEALKLRDSGMAIGMIDKVIYGVASVANARFNRDVSEAVYKANMESINAIKVLIKVLMNQYDKEYGAHE